MHNLSKLPTLCHNMKQQNWQVTGFPFQYRSNQYDVILDRNLTNKQRNKYIAKLVFIKNYNMENCLSVFAEGTRLSCDISTLKEFFETSGFIKYQDWIDHFYECFNSAIPVNPNCNAENSKQLIQYINRQENNENRIYPFAIQCDPEHTHRSTYNTDKTRLICPDLYNNFLVHDNTLSVRFSNQKEKALDQGIILDNFLKSHPTYHK